LFPITVPTSIYTLSLHDALPIFHVESDVSVVGQYSYPVSPYSGTFFLGLLNCRTELHHYPLLRHFEKVEARLARRWFEEEAGVSTELDYFHIAVDYDACRREF